MSVLTILMHLHSFVFCFFLLLLSWFAAKFGMTETQQVTAGNGKREKWWTSNPTLAATNDWKKKERWNPYYKRTGFFGSSAFLLLSQMLPFPRGSQAFFALHFATYSKNVEILRLLNIFLLLPTVFKGKTN